MLAGGSLADRFGRKTLLMWSTGLSAALVASQAAYVVLGQEYVPSHLGIASG